MNRIESNIGGYHVKSRYDFLILLFVLYVSMYMQTHTVVKVYFLVGAQSLKAMSSSLQPHGLQPTRLLCPWGFSRQEYWSGLPCPRPGDLPHPGIKPSLLCCRRILYHLSHQGSPFRSVALAKITFKPLIYTTFQDSGFFSSTI